MRQYVDGYVLPVAKKNVKKYQRDAKAAGKMWMKRGALAYFECAADDLGSAAKMDCLPFPKLVKNAKTETILFSFIVYKSRKHRDQVNARVQKDMEKLKGRYKHYTMPFDVKRMAFGGFKSIVQYGAFKK